MNAEQMDEIKRHFGVVAESLRSDIRRIAEGHAIIRHEHQEHPCLSFSQLDQRSHTRESDVTTLKIRTDRLETAQA